MPETKEYSTTKVKAYSTAEVEASRTKEVEEYSTAEFRTHMADAFEKARHDSEKIVCVKHHGKPWVSIVSPAEGETVQRVRSTGDITVAELRAAMKSVPGNEQVSLDYVAELVKQYRENPKARNGRRNRARP